MTAVWGCVALLIIAFVPQTILAQEEKPTGDAPAPGKDEKAEPVKEPPKPPSPPSPPMLKDDGNSSAVLSNTLFGPVESEDVYDAFRYEHSDYLFVGQGLLQKDAEIMCDVLYHGRLAIIKTKVLASFLAEALSETNLILDALWTAGVKKAPPGINTTDVNDTEKVWYWEQRKGEKSEIDKTLISEFKITDVDASDRDCLTFARKDHNIPQYQPITCRARRPYLCVRPEGGGDTNGSTHPGWIKLGKRLYKIFATSLNYADARKFCVATADVESDLAVVLSFNHSQQLGRYLLIGRPSLENGWLGAIWNSDSSSYGFQPENFPLANATDSTGFPPWRGNHVQKVGGCVLLDRHIANITLFVEARCERLRPTICYKPDKGEFGNISFGDIIIEPHGYRIIYNNKTWKQARDFCKIQYAKYDSKLVEIDAEVHVYNLLYAMGENKTAVQHIWIGGRYNTTLSPPKWTWDSTGAEVQQSILRWINNDSYTDSVESSYVCMNMDRENHLTALHYGTTCTTRQPFVCYFTAEKLRQLETDEEKTHGRDD